MKRKDFLNSSISIFAGAVLPLEGRKTSVDDNGKADNETLPVIPPYLKEGDHIGITSPAGYISLEEIQPSIQLMESWGYKIRIGETIGKRDFTFGEQMMNVPGTFRICWMIKVLKPLCAPGGGMVLFVLLIN